VKINTYRKIETHRQIPYRREQWKVIAGRLSESGGRSKKPGGVAVNIDKEEEFVTILRAVLRRGRTSPANAIASQLRLFK
jgi:hypothetical protein